MSSTSDGDVTVALRADGCLPVCPPNLIRMPGVSVSILLSLVVIATGCSSNDIPTYPVEGIVTLDDGTPVQTGTVEFNSLDQNLTARGSIQSDGTFRLTTFKDGDGAVAGAHDAVVVQLISTEDLSLHEHDHGPTIDPKFAHYDSAGLRFTVHTDRTNSIRVLLTPVKSDSENAESPVFP